MTQLLHPFSFLTWLGWEVKWWKELEERDASKAAAKVLGVYFSTW